MIKFAPIVIHIEFEFPAPMILNYKSVSIVCDSNKKNAKAAACFFECVFSCNISNT